MNLSSKNQHGTVKLSSIEEMSYLLTDSGEILHSTHKCRSTPLRHFHFPNSS